MNEQGDLLKRHFCAVEVGLHPGPYWFDKLSKIIVCSRHKKHYEESEDEYGPFDWELVEYECEWAGNSTPCDNPVRGFIQNDPLDDEEHPLCWNHLNPDLHPERLKENIYPRAQIVSPCRHAKIKQKQE